MDWLFNDGARRLALFLLLLSGAGGCVRLQTAFHCSAEKVCIHDGQIGTCEPSGYCSFPDSSCSGIGRRYGSAAPNGIALQCVNATDDGGPDLSAASDGGGHLDMMPDLLRLGVNLIPNGTFESGVQGWGDSTGILSQVGIAHSGQYGAQVCDPGASMTYDIDDKPDPVIDPDPGQVYLAQAWVHAAPGAIDTQTVTPTMRGKISAQISISDDGTPVTLTPGDASWHQIQVQRAVSERDLSLDAFFHAAGTSTSDCFIIDDITLVRLQ